MNGKGAENRNEPHRLPSWLTRTGAVLCFGLGAIFCVAIGVVPMMSCARAISLRAPLVTVHPRDAVTFPLTIGFLCFAVMSALPDLQIRLRPSRRSITARRANQAATVLIAVAAFAMLLVPFAPPATSLLFGWIAAHHGYRACPPPLSNRYGKLSWALNAHSCPAID